MRLPFAPAKLSLSALLLVSAPLLLQGCSEAPQQQQGQMHPAAVATMTMETHDAPFTIELPATLSGQKKLKFVPVSPVFLNHATLKKVSV